jgi:hypothetical protein
MNFSKCKLVSMGTVGMAELTDHHWYYLNVSRAGLYLADGLYDDGCIYMDTDDMGVDVTNYGALIIEPECDLI